MEFEAVLREYEEKREALVRANANLTGLSLREDEKRLDSLLTELRAELRETLGGEVPYNMPMLTDRRLTGSRLYRFLSRMPKGADLHVHDMSLLPARELIALLRERPEFCISADRKSFDLRAEPVENDAPEGYIRFSEALDTHYYSEEELVENWTVLGAERSGMGIWDYFEELFCRHGALSDNADFASAYYRRTFRYYCEKNIMHVEIHMMLTGGIDESAEYLKTVREAYYDVKRDYPYFTVRVIGAGVKADSENIETTKTCFLNTAYVQDMVKDGADGDDFIIGFDLVNEEDTSLPLHAFVPMLLKAKRHFPAMKLYIHGGESLDARNENLIDAYLLGVSRVGHGLNLYRFPDLHAKYAASEICLEVCPISNQTLGYTKDIRNHPATEYLRSGVALSLCSDDPAYMENETLTDDFFAAAVGWELSLADLKQLALNSLLYSGLSEKRKTESLRAFRELWNGFVADVLQNGV